MEPTSCRDTFLDSIYVTNCGIKYGREWQFYGTGGMIEILKKLQELAD